MSKSKRRLWDTESTIHYTPTFPPSQTPSLPPGSWGLRETPMGRADTVASGVVVPFLQGLIVGFWPGILTTIAAGAAVILLDWPWWLSPLLGVTVLATIASTQVTTFVQNRQEMLWKREEVERRDLDQDGHIGKPPKYYPMYVGRAPNSTLPSRGPIAQNNFLKDPRDLDDFVRDGFHRGITRRPWVENVKYPPRLKRSGNPVTRDYYDILIAILADAGVVEPGGDGRANRFLYPLDRTLSILHTGREPGGRDTSPHFD